MTFLTPAASAKTFGDKPKHGFLLGKFMPPHEGHRFLANFALAHCEKLTIMVGTMPHEPIPGYLRAEWMKQMFPNANVVWCDEVLPQDPSETPDFWDIWRDAIHRYVPESVDVVYASEHYGHPLAAELGARFVPVDIRRSCRPISGTAVRNDPMGNWAFIPPVVRPYFCRRVTLFGPESTGKSTLAAALGEHYGTVVVPEYGRTYTEAFGLDVGPDDLRNIVQGHVASVAAAKQAANRFLIEDTDPVMTAVWADMLGQGRDPWFEGYADLPELYLLCDVDIPWVNDGNRYFADQADRQRFFDLCESELRRRGARYEIIRGSQEKRIELAKAAIDRLVLAGENNKD